MLLPRLRPLDIQRVRHGGHDFFLMGDPLRLRGDEQLLVPVVWGPLLMSLDGTHTLAAARRELSEAYGVDLPAAADVDGMLRALSEGLLLDDDRFRRAVAGRRAEFRAASWRPMALTPGVYPAEPAAATARLRGYEATAGAEEDPATTASLAGLISPHIDYHRGGPLYARLWRQAAPALRQAEVAVIFGTDHHGSAGTLTLTRQSYATPWGPLPTERAAVDAMAEALGEERAYAEELHHCDEHSIELAAVWLHHVRDGRPLAVVPVLCGHPLPYLEGCTNGDGVAGEAWQRATTALAALRSATAGKRVVTIAAADLAHAGPAFGDPAPLSPHVRDAIRGADEALLDACGAGPADVLRVVRRIDDRFRVCGLSPIALTLAMTGAVRTAVAGYEHAPADHDGGDGSIVSIAGVLLSRP